MATTQTLTTAEEFETICHQIGPCELVRGEIVRLVPGGFGHSRISVNAGYFLAQWARQSGLGRVIGCEAGIVVEVGPDTVRGADVAFISYNRLPKGAQSSGFLTIPPELVVEIIGKGQGWREMVEKAGEYLGMGVDRVWVIDPDSKRVHIFRADAEPVVLSAKDTLFDDTVLPGFSCHVADLFAD